MDAIWNRCRLLAVSVFYVLLLFVAAYSIVQWRQPKPVVLSIQSSSMQPALHKGDAVVLKHVGQNDIRRGDIVSFADPERAGAIISHRVVSVDTYTGRLVTKGDANLTADQPTSVVNVLGRTGYVLPGFGRAVELLRSWQGLVVCIYAPAFLLVVQELRRLAANYGRPTYVVRGHGAMAPVNTGIVYRVSQS